MNADSFSGVLENQALELRLGTEIQQEADFDLCCPKVVQQLRLMRRFQVARSLQFQENRSLDEHVRSELAERFPPKRHLHRHLTVRAETGLRQGDGHRPFVNRFEKAMPQLVVNLLENANDSLGQLPMLDLVSLPVHPPASNFLRTLIGVHPR
ncbi:MAG TPA: hypothetical protein VGS20_16860 [Candidatus Acidoferrales bacterium]|nr:hypothetical protein [Candidatus Acidoferrales bacterium]